MQDISSYNKIILSKKLKEDIFMSKFISRREFLKGSAAGVAAMTAMTALGALGVPTALADAEKDVQLATEYCNGYENTAGIGIV